MSYIVIDDFKLGMDRRKERVAGVAGALWLGVNGHINRGGSFERRKKFVNTYALPAGTTFGLCDLNGQLFVFGSSASPGAIPAGVNYQRLAHPASANMTSIIDVSNFGGNIYAIAQFDNGDIFHYYNGSRVTDWDNVAGAITSNTAIAAAFANQINLDPRYTATSVGSVLTIIDSASPGSGFTLSQVVVQAGANDQTITLATPQPNQAFVAETPAAFTITIQAGTPPNTADTLQNAIRTLHDTNGLALIGAGVPWVVSNAFTAQSLANAINAQFDALALTGVVGYTATFSTNIVTVAAPAGAGTANNGLHIHSRTTGNFDWDSGTVTGITNTGSGEVDCGAQSGGVNAVPAIAQVSTATFAGTTGGSKATGTISFASSGNPSNNDTITLNGVVWTFVTGTPSGNQTKISAVNLAATLTQLAADLTASTNASLLQAAYTVSSTVLTVTSAFFGTTGNSYTIAASAATAGGAHLTGGGWLNSAAYQLTLIGDAITEVFNITGLAAGYGITCKAYNQRIWSVTTSLLEYCAINDPTTWSNPTGNGTSGFINMTNNDANNDALVGIQQYQDRIAVYTRKNLQIWILSVTPSDNTYVQSVQNTGALSNRTIQQYGNIDVFYLDTSGVRSVRARDASNAPAVNDVGVSIDAFLQAFTSTLTGKQIGRACSVIEPIDGRYWLAINNRIFAYSFFPGSKISAWTYYDLIDEIGSADITEMVRSGNRIYLRSGDNIYLYGGVGNAIYPNANEIISQVQIPFLSANKPGTPKGIASFDIGCTNAWHAYLLPNCADDTIELDIGIFDQPTYSLNKQPIQMPTPLFAINLSCSAAGSATISNMAVHFDYDE